MKKKIYLFISIFSSIILNAQWQQTSGGYGIPIYSFAMKDSTIFAGGNCSFGSDIFVSTNNGNNWAPKHNGLPSFTNATSIAIHDTTVFVSLAAQGLYRTMDKGNTWSVVDVDQSISTDCITSVGVKDSIIFAGTCSNGIYFSTDNGNTWNTSGSFSPDNVSCFQTVGTKIFASVFQSGIYVSSNNGATWSTVNSGLPSLNVTKLGANGSTLFSGGPYSSYGAYSSINYGASWNIANNGLPSGVGVTSFASNGSVVFTAVQTSVFMSLNNGLNWIDISTGLMGNYVSALTVHGNYLYAGTNSSGPGTIWRRSLNEVVTGIRESDKMEIKVSLYPNPSDLQVNLYTNKVLEDATIEIYNSLGEQVKQIEKVNGQLITIKHDDLSDGIYFLNVIQDNQLLLKQKMVIEN